jgi:hypothetical protein
MVHPTPRHELIVWVATWPWSIRHHAMNSSFAACLLLSFFPSPSTKCQGCIPRFPLPAQSVKAVYHGRSCAPLFCPFFPLPAQSVEAVYHGRSCAPLSALEAKSSHSLNIKRQGICSVGKGKRPHPTPPLPTPPPQEIGGTTRTSLGPYTFVKQHKNASFRVHFAVARPLQRVVVAAPLKRLKVT